MIPLRSITSRTITAPASLVRRSTRDSMTTPALKLGWKVDGVSPMGCSALADIAAQIPESATHLAQEPAQSAVSTNIVGSEWKLVGRLGIRHQGRARIRPEYPRTEALEMDDTVIPYQRPAVDEHRLCQLELQVLRPLRR